MRPREPLYERTANREGVVTDVTAPHTRSAGEVAVALDVDTMVGLSDDTAVRRLAVAGPNAIAAAAPAGPGSPKHRSSRPRN